MYIKGVNLGNWLVLEKYTAPDGQNGFDNGGISGVCKWSQESEEKCIVIHDAFLLKAWKDFMREDKYKNVVLDTHQYLMMSEGMDCEQSVEGYVKFIKENYEADIFIY